MTRVEQAVKRAFDLSASIIGLVVLSPILICLAIWVKIDSKGPVFYRGERVGRYGKPFRIFKFRTMVVEAEKIGPSSVSGDDQRITKVGSVLRRFKLDELPQLMNVISGEMSLVGPRPEVKRFVDEFSEEEKQILTVRPGITDWSSLNFPNEDEILKAHIDEYPDADEAYAVYIRPEKIRLQKKYIQNASIWIDIQIIFKTLTALIKKVK